jgi:hypothetical protein
MMVSLHRDTRLLLLMRADTASDSADVHEDKRQHQTKAAAKKGGRKSVGDDGKGGSKSDKAARRKEQNRAAQKAFRERREAKVKDVSGTCDLSVASLMPA